MGSERVLIDRHHKGWIFATVAIGAAATALYTWFDHRIPGGVTGGSVVELWYGILGSALMVYAGLLSVLRKVPSWWWIGSRKVWLRGHLWLGLLSELFILLHSGFRGGGPLEQILWVVLTLTIATGILGVVIQQWVPRMITFRFTHEAPYEQIPHLCSVLRRRADAIVDSLCPHAGEVASPQAGGTVTATLAPGPVALLDLYDLEIRPFLGDRYQRSSPLTNPRILESRLATISAMAWGPESLAKIATLATLCEDRRQLGEQERLHQLLHTWLLVHVPLSVMLLVLGLAHAVMSLYY